MFTHPHLQNQTVKYVVWPIARLFYFFSHIISFIIGFNLLMIPTFTYFCCQNVCKRTFPFIWFKIFCSWTVRHESYQLFGPFLTIEREVGLVNLRVRYLQRLGSHHYDSVRLDQKRCCQSTKNHRPLCQKPEKYNLNKFDEHISNLRIKRTSLSSDQIKHDR